MKLRVARHTDTLQPLIHFYHNLLGLSIIGQFTGHNGYDGIFIGPANADWHLEFTASGEKANHRADDDDLLVLYFDSVSTYENVKTQLKNNHIPEIPAKNPYWAANGIMYADPDGFRVVLVLTV